MNLHVENLRFTFTVYSILHQFISFEQYFFSEIKFELPKKDFFSFFMQILTLFPIFIFLSI